MTKRRGKKTKYVPHHAITHHGQMHADPQKDPNRAHQDGEGLSQVIRNLFRRLPYIVMAMTTIVLTILLNFVDRLSDLLPSSLAKWGIILPLSISGAILTELIKVSRSVKDSKNPLFAWLSALAVVGICLLGGLLLLSLIVNVDNDEPPATASVSVSDSPVTSAPIQDPLPVYPTAIPTLTHAPTAIPSVTFTPTITLTPTITPTPTLDPTQYCIAEVGTDRKPSYDSLESIATGTPTHFLNDGMTGIIAGRTNITINDDAKTYLQFKTGDLIVWVIEGTFKDPTGNCQNIPTVP